MPSGRGSFDAVIIGAGVIGCGIAFELSRRGWRTVNVDKLPAAGYGSTSSSSAIVRFSYSTEAGVALAWEGYHYWTGWSNYLELDDPGPLAQFVPLPMLTPNDGSGYYQRVRELLANAGIEAQSLSAAQLTERFPFLDLRKFGPPARLEDSEAPFWGEPNDQQIEGLIMPQCGYISDPQLAAQNLKDAAQAKGATFLFNQTVSAVDQTDGRAAGVTLADGTAIGAPVVVNVAGPHSSHINALAGVTEEMGISTRALRREVYVVPAPPGVDFEREGLMMGDLDVGVYFRSESGNNVLIGSTEPECDPLIWLVDPDQLDETLDHDEFQLGVLRASRRLSGLGVPHQKKGLVSAYDVTDDWIPIYDLSSLPGFYMAVGSSGNQFKNAPSASHCMAELILAVEDGLDHDAEPLLVQGRHTGATIDMATFSRLRSVDPNSSNTVLG